MAEIKVIIEGVHKSLEEGKLLIGSTVTLIKGEENILVDTGTFLDRENLIKGLKEEELSLEDINKVILTHLHLDHVVNVDLFNKAKIYCKFKSGGYPGQYHSLSKGYAKRTDIFDNVEISKGVKFLTTPGHSGDSISLVVETKKGIVVIAGDAIATEAWADLKKEQSVKLTANLEEFNKSRKKILDIADYIIPGHGKMFKVK